MESEVRHDPPADDPDYERYLERSIDLVARVRTAREAAQREMESFGQVSEYEIRKLYGERSGSPYAPPDQVPKSETLSPAREGFPLRQQPLHQDSVSSNHSQASFDFEPPPSDTRPNRPQKEE